MMKTMTKIDDNDDDLYFWDLLYLGIGKHSAECPSDRL